MSGKSHRRGKASYDPASCKRSSKDLTMQPASRSHSVSHCPFHLCCTWIPSLNYILRQSVRPAVRCRRVGSSPKPRKPEWPQHVGPKDSIHSNWHKLPMASENESKTAISTANLSNPRARQQILVGSGHLPDHHKRQPSYTMNRRLLPLPPCCLL